MDFTRDEIAVTASLGNWMHKSSCISIYSVLCGQTLSLLHIKLYLYFGAEKPIITGHHRLVVCAHQYSFDLMTFSTASQSQHIGAIFRCEPPLAPLRESTVYGDTAKPRTNPVC